MRGVILGTLALVAAGQYETPARNPPQALVNRFKARRLCRVPPRGMTVRTPATKHSDGDGEPQSRSRNWEGIPQWPHR